MTVATDMETISDRLLDYIKITPRLPSLISMIRDISHTCILLWWICCNHLQWIWKGVKFQTHHKSIQSNHKNWSCHIYRIDYSRQMCTKIVRTYSLISFGCTTGCQCYVQGDLLLACNSFGCSEETGRQPRFEQGSASLDRDCITWSPH